jgi:hypothetical protein
MNELTPNADLAGLAERINAEHAAAADSLRAGLQHARRAGALLVEAKAKMAHGQWIPWLEKNVRCAPRTAQTYMRVAERWHELEATAQPLALLTFQEATRLLAKPTCCTAEDLETAHDQVDEVFRKNMLAGISEPQQKAWVEAVFADVDRLDKARAQIHKEMEECERVTKEVGAVLAAGREIEPKLFAELVRHNRTAGTWTKRFKKIDQETGTLQLAAKGVRDAYKARLAEVEAAETK